MSTKKMTLLVSSGLLFFLVLSTVINTISVKKHQENEKITKTIKYEYGLGNMVSSYNFVEVVQAVKEEEIVKEEKVEVIENNEQEEEETTDSDSVYVGKMTGYGADCVGCSGLGSLSCKAKDGSRHTLLENGEYYTDDSYGTVRIVAADLASFPCGTIVKVDHPVLGTFNAVVMDTGGSVKNAMKNGLVWMDLAFKTESDPAIYSTTSNNTTYTVLRMGW